jgi:hypothetical protein
MDYLMDETWPIDCLPYDILKIIVSMVGKKARLVCKLWKGMIKLTFMEIKLNEDVQIEPYKAMFESNDIQTLKVVYDGGYGCQPRLNYTLGGRSCIKRLIVRTASRYGGYTILEFIQDNADILTSVEELDTDWPFLWPYGALIAARFNATDAGSYSFSDIFDFANCDAKKVIVKGLKMQDEVVWYISGKSRVIIED